MNSSTVKTQRLRNSKSTRGAVPLGQPLQRRLAAYAGAAAATAAGLVATAPAAQAQIVYTPAHQTATCGLTACSRSIFIDFNQDGLQDFQIHLSYSPSQNQDVLDVYGNKNQQGDILQGYYGTANVFHYGDRIGKSGSYFRRAAFMAVNCLHTSRNCASGGLWAERTNAFLGFKFTLSDGYHWGWAEVSTRSGTDSITVHLEGYAYDTVPDQRIRAGQTDDEGIPQAALDPGSLGMLALGASTLRLRRPKNP